MAQATVSMTTRRVSDRVSIIDVKGSVTATSEGALMDAWGEASGDSTRSIILNFEALEYLNSTGIGLLVTLLVRANRQRQRLLAFGLNEHYRHIFELTRLNDAIGIFADQAAAIAAAQAA
jgi:anti-sigma B factor antagonist